MLVFVGVVVVAASIVVAECNEVISSVVSTVTVIDVALSLFVASSIQVSSITHVMIIDRQ